jgi:hypothetical protein
VQTARPRRSVAGRLESDVSHVKAQPESGERSASGL